MKNTKTAFTLIELLVVISIIALLIGILLPALGAARGVARISASASNQRQIGVAMAAYQADNDEYFPLWQRGNSDDEDSLDFQIGEPVEWFWTTKLAVDNYIPGLEIYADPTFDADTSFLDVALDRNSQNFGVFNYIHYGYNYVWVGSNLAGALGRPAAKRSANNPNTTARTIDMDDPTSVMVTSGVRDFNPQGKRTDRSTPTIDPDGNYGAHVFIDYGFEVGNAGRQHARYNGSIQSCYADGHVSAIQMPFTQEQQDATGDGYTAQPTSEVALYGPNALGDPQLWGSSNRSGDDPGNYFDLRSGNP